ncbi:acryloyl-CoA reductase [Saccharospirillum impatiens]|uniref:acrylyl-CoA reductase family protein n=1 Tax=Saccharospirillum impatiens TaxID=169438 RepID=UPI0003FD68DC|nr:acryloyl-CoA reductase [Saccharospirillum impatiens]
MTTYRALRIHLTDQGVTRTLEDRAITELPDHDVLIRVHWSSLNYKDALSANGHKGVSRYYPHTPGIDAAGVVERDHSGRFQPGTQVAVIGFDLGMNTQGGFADYVCVPADWVVTLPTGLTMADSMRLGTAGVTAAYCLEKLIETGVRADEGPVLVTGATGGVGSLAVHLLATLGYKVTAVTGKVDAHDWLRQLGATDILPREALSEPEPKALRPALFAGAIDTIGDHTLVNILKSLRYGGSVAACGIVGGTAIPADIFPFILRGVNLLGIASADAPVDARTRVLAKYAGLWKLPMLSALSDTLTLDQLGPRIDAMLAGNVQRRALIQVCED